jgi:GGDEF domain-containing protein
VSDVVVERLFDEVEGLAKRWVLALIAARPLREVGGIPVERIAREAPTLCAQVLRALSSDEALARLARGAGPHERGDDAELAIQVGQLAGASDAASTVYAVEALRGALWQGFGESLPGLTAGQTGALADRLAHVCSSLCAAALSGSAAPASAVRAHEEPIAPAHELAEATPGATFPRIERREEQGPRAADAGNLGWEIDEEPPEPPAHATEPWPGGSASWLDTVTAELEPDEERGQRLAILVIEVVDIERLRRAEGVDELGSLTARVETALARGLRPGDRLAQEGAGRWWLVAPQTSSKGARLLAERLAANVRAAVSHRGVPLGIAVGVASAPDDGAVPSQLAELAERDLFAARAAGLSVAPGR